MPALWLGIAFLIGLAAGHGPVFGVACLAATSAVLAWRIVSRWAPPLLALGLLILALGLTVPTSVQALGEASLALFVLWSTIQAYERGDNRWHVGATCTAVALTWLLLGFNPNVPGWSVAIDGVRKTTLLFVGLAAGALWPDRTRRRAGDVIIALLALGGIASLVLHFAAPSVELSFIRKAGVYTSLFAGKPRLQGIFAGPFHVALLGTFLVLRAWHLYIVRHVRRWQVLVPLAALGWLLIVFASVRTAYLTVALGIVVTPLLTRSVRNDTTKSLALLRTAAVGLVLALAFASGLGSNSALSSIPQIGQTTRDIGRLSTWAESISLFAHSPLFGEGPGSASATLGSSFTGHRYITADNEFLAVAVEGGLIGLLAIATVFLAIRRSLRDIFDPASPSAAAALALFGFSFTGNTFEAVPVSTFLAIVIGVSVVGSGSQSVLEKGA